MFLFHLHIIWYHLFFLTLLVIIRRVFSKIDAVSTDIGGAVAMSLTSSLPAPRLYARVNECVSTRAVSLSVPWQIVFLCVAAWDVQSIIYST